MSITCLEVQDRLSAWLDDELAPEERTRLARHLESCAGCRRELARLEALDQVLGSWSAPVPPGLPEKVRARLKPPARPWRQSLALAASLVLGIYLGGALVRDYYPQQQENGGVMEVASLDAFQDFPQGSLGMILASYQGDEGNGNGR